MLSPKFVFALLPQDRQIMDLTGMSEEEYRWFCKQAHDRSKLQPGEPVAFEPVTFAITLAVGVLLSVAASLLTPKPKKQEARRFEEETIAGQDIIRRDVFSPKAGFDSVQNVVELGSTVPLIYTKNLGKITWKNNTLDGQQTQLEKDSQPIPPKD